MMRLLPSPYPSVTIRRRSQVSEIMGNECLTGALLDRITHRVHIIEANGESYRLKDAKKRSKGNV